MRAWVRCLIVLVAVLTMSGVARADDNSLRRVLDAGTLNIGVAVNPPWAFKRPDGAWAGRDVELLSAMAGDLGVKPRFVETSFAELVPRLGRGEVDVAAAGLAITPGRALIVAFSSPTRVQEIGVVADRRAIGQDADKAFAQPSFKIAVLGRSTDEAAARRAFSKAQVIAYPSAAAALSALVGGEVQAMVATSPAPNMAATLYDAKLTLIPGTLERNAEALALRPDDVRLLVYVNNWVAARQADGFLGDLDDYWFKGSRWLEMLGSDQRPPAVR